MSATIANTNSELEGDVVQGLNDLDKLLGELFEAKQTLTMPTPTPRHSAATNAESAADDDLDLASPTPSTHAHIHTCHACNKPVMGRVITALGYMWHPEHFNCHYCRQNIGTCIFYERANRPYCERDYLELFSPKCNACAGPILDVC